MRWRTASRPPDVSADPMPHATAPAEIHWGTSSIPTPPVGIRAACGRAARTSFSQPGD
jgi:hypothetical protein